MRNPSPPAAASDAELVVGGIASIFLIGFGTYLVYSSMNPPGQTPSTESTLEDTSALASVAVLAV